MKAAVFRITPKHKLRLSKIDPEDTGNLNKNASAQCLAELHEKISVLQQRLFAEHRRSLLIIFQALDTGGKDGAIKSLCSGLNPAGLEIASFKVPTQVELDHDFLWRAHKVAPSRGMIGIWNRSHYEDVLVVRVHKLIAKKVWEARYEQINAFEEILCANGTSVVKFMLHISKDEQKKRLEARLHDPEKQWKFNPNDLKERALWDDYQRAYEDAVNCCATKSLPWYVVPANHKWARNIAVAEIVLRVLTKMDPRFPNPSFDPKAITIA
jgi:PPK2 family polyphosphate:nucleotide phosphotransferase